ncbi:unannotated protein [freshwater metagenome]|uniref:Unannotated protein n=1 Tax=freshwater metagenome TaxID=449393 RepID=A0A6J7AC13_9ZZZZ
MSEQTLNGFDWNATPNEATPDHLPPAPIETLAEKLPDIVRFSFAVEVATSSAIVTLPDTLTLAPPHESPVCQLPLPGVHVHVLVAVKFQSLDGARSLML